MTERNEDPPADALFYAAWQRGADPGNIDERLRELDVPTDSPGWRSLVVYCGGAAAALELLHGDVGREVAEQLIAGAFLRYTLETKLTDEEEKK